MLVALFLLSVFVQYTQSCGGTWTHQKVSASVSLSPLDTCVYEKQSIGATPQDIRNDTQFLGLISNSLTENSTNMTLIASQILQLSGLDLSCNRFTQIPDIQLFHESLIYLNLYKNKIVSLELNYLSQMNMLHTLIMSDNKISYDLVVPLDPNANLSIKHLDLNNNNLTIVHFGYINTGEFDILELRNNSIKQIIPAQIDQKLSVKTINLEYNLLTKIDFNWFVWINNLGDLLLKGNPISRLIFPDAPNKVKITKLHIQDMTIESKTVFQNISNVRQLTITNCSFTGGELDLNNFIHLTDLQTLYTSQTNISRIVPLTTGNSLKTLQNLFLDQSKLSGCLNVTYFGGNVMPSLYRINLQYLPDMFLCPTGQDFAPTVKFVSLAKSKLSGCFNLTKLLKQFPNLVTLDMNWNLLTSLCFDHNHTSGIEVLSMYQNKFTELDLGVFARISPKLRKLNVQWNLLTKVSLHLAPGESLLYLDQLILNDNPLTAISPYCNANFNTFSFGFQLQLQNTKLECNRCLSWIKTCPYNINFGGTQPVCAGPQEVAGDYVSDVTLLQMSEVKCLNESATASSTWFVKSGPAVNSVTTILTVAHPRGEMDCACITAAVGGASFTHHNNDTCVVYYDRSGAYDNVSH